MELISQDLSIHRKVLWLRKQYRWDDSYCPGGNRGKVSSKVPVSEIRDVLREEFGHISVREAGLIVGKAFPRCKRERSYKQGKCYYGIYKITPTESGTDEAVLSSNNGTSLDDRSRANVLKSRILKLEEENETLHAKVRQYKDAYRVIAGKLKTSQAEKQVLMTSRAPERRTGTIPAAYCIDRTLLSPVHTPLSKNDIVLGEGTFGQCKLYSYRGSNVAVKEFKPSASDNEVKKDLVHEAKVLMNIFTHKSIPALIGVVMDRPPFMLITSFHGINNESVTLLTALRNGIQFVNVAQWKDVFGQVATGLNHIHSCGFLHCDLKLNNVCLEKKERSYVAIIIDFGKSCETHKPTGYPNLNIQERERRVNKYPHIDPSLYRVRGSVHSVWTDIYSFGKMVENVVCRLGIDDGQLNTVWNECVCIDKSLRPALTRVVSTLVS